MRLKMTPVFKLLCIFPISLQIKKNDFVSVGKMKYWKHAIRFKWIIYQTLAFCGCAFKNPVNCTLYTMSLNMWWKSDHKSQRVLSLNGACSCLPWRLVTKCISYGLIYDRTRRETVQKTQEVTWHCVKHEIFLQKCWQSTQFVTVPAASKQGKTNLIIIRRN